VIEYLDRFCDVSPFLSECKPLLNVPIVNAATAYHHPDLGELFILLFNQAFYMGDQVEASLLCLNQMRAHGGAIVDNCPIHLSPNHSSTHSIYVAEHDLQIPLQLDGIVLYIDTFCPSDDDLEHGTWVEMTWLTGWDPYSQDFLQQKEKAMSEDEGYSHCWAVNSVGTHQALSDVVLSSVLPLLTPELLVEELDLRVAQVSYTHSEIMTTKAGAHRGSIGTEELARCWNIGLKTTKKTIQVTTQRGKRNVVHPIHQRFCTCQSHLWYPLLNTTVNSDTLFTTLKSTRSNTCSQVFVTDFDFTWVLPMKLKGDAPFVLQDFIHDIGILRHIHTDDVKELMASRWKKIVNKYGIKQTHTKPYSPWQNWAEAMI